MQRPHVSLTPLFVVVLLLSAPPAHAQSASLQLTGKPEAVAEFRLGWAALEANDAEPALRHLKAAIDLDPNFGLARVVYALQRPGSPALQKAEFDRGVADAAKGSTAEVTVALAIRELGLGHLSSPPLWKAAVEIVPDDPLLAMYEASQGDPANSYEKAKAVAAKFPGSGPAHNYLAYAAWIAGDHALALAEAEKQVELMPANPNSHDTYAEILQWNGKFAEALHHYGEAVALDSNFVESLIGMAEVETLQNHGDKASAYVRQAIARTTNPLFKLAYTRDLITVDVLTRKGEHQFPLLEAAIREAKAQDDSASAAVLLAQTAAVHAANGNAKKAHEYIAMAQSIHHDPPAGILYYEAMAHALLKHWGPAEAALTAAKTAPDAFFNAGRLAAAEAFIATMQGRPKDAIAVLSKGDMTDPIVVGRLAEAYNADGNKAEAIRLQQQISNDRALNLYDWAAGNARARAASFLEDAAKAKKK